MPARRKAPRRSPRRSKGSRSKSPRRVLKRRSSGKARRAAATRRSLKRTGLPRHSRNFRGSLYDCIVPIVGGSVKGDVKCNRMNTEHDIAVGEAVIMCQISPALIEEVMNNDDVKTGVVFFENPFNLRMGVRQLKRACAAKNLRFTSAFDNLSGARSSKLLLTQMLPDSTHFPCLGKPIVGEEGSAHVKMKASQLVNEDVPENVKTVLDAWHTLERDEDGNCMITLDGESRQFDSVIPGVYNIPFEDFIKNPDTRHALLANMKIAAFKTVTDVEILDKMFNAPYTPKGVFADMWSMHKFHLYPHEKVHLYTDAEMDDMMAIGDLIQRNTNTKFVIHVAQDFWDTFTDTKWYEEVGKVIQKMAHKSGLSDRIEIGAPFYASANFEKAAEHFSATFYPRANPAWHALSGMFRAIGNERKAFKKAFEEKLTQLAESGAGSDAGAKLITTMFKKVPMGIPLENFVRGLFGDIEQSRFYNVLKHY